MSYFEEVTAITDSKCGRIFTGCVYHVVVRPKRLAREYVVEDHKNDRIAISEEEYGRVFEGTDKPNVIEPTRAICRTRGCEEPAMPGAGLCWGHGGDDPALRHDTPAELAHRTEAAQYEEPRPQPTSGSRRRVKRMVVSFEVLMDVFTAQPGATFRITDQPLPPGAKMVGTGHDLMANAQVFFFEHESFPEVDPATVPDELTPTFMYWSPVDPGRPVTPLEAAALAGGEGH